MDLFAGYIWIFISQLVETLFWVFTRIFMRYFSHVPINSACSSNLCQENYHTDSKISESKTEDEEDCSKYSRDAELKSEEFEEGTDAIQFKRECSHQNDSNGYEPEAKSNEFCSEAVSVTNQAKNLGLEEEETMKLVFKFQYQTWKCSETFDLVNADNDKASGSTTEHEFISGKSFSNFLDEPCVHSKFFPLENDSVNESGRNFEPERCVHEAVKLKTMPSIEQPQPDEHQVENLNTNVFVEEISDDDNFLSFELDTLGNHDEENTVLTKEGLDFEGEKRSESFDVGDRDIMVEIRKIEKENIMQDSDIENTKLKGQHCFQDRYGRILHGSRDSDLDAQWEHQDLIEQLKMELNKVRATGLATTFETQRIMEDLKPWEIDEKFQHFSTINDLTKFYKSYTERMRKFDILNFQKLFAIGSLKTKDLMLSFPSRENCSPTITSFLPHIFQHSRRKKSESDTLKKFMGEFYSDLEMAYVGQLCLSWEFLQWEYENALQLWESDHYSLQSYNKVAEEFQQFQVLLLRFIENEPFQGPRVEYYARNRCAMQNLLQVPLLRAEIIVRMRQQNLLKLCEGPYKIPFIKQIVSNGIEHQLTAEDNTKDEEKFKTKDEITSDMLVEILEESIKTLWHFIKADKDASCLSHKGPRETQAKFQDPADSELHIELQAELHKKDKRLNELSKSRSSILKKFRKHEEIGRDNFLYFFPQGDMKLAWRVLNMSKITRDQLAWCRNKLNNINFVNRRIHIEPSFLLFPCQ